MWNELETLVKTHAGATDRHQRVLDCIIACRSKPPEEEDRKKRGRKREEREDRTEKNGSKETDDKSWQDSERSVVPENLQFVLANNLVYHFSMWIHSLFLLSLLDTTEKKEIKEPNFNICDVCSSVSKTKGFDG